MGRFVVLPMPLGGAIFKTLYAELAASAVADVRFGYDPSKGLPYAELEVRDLTRAAARLFKQRLNFMTEVGGVPLIRGVAPGTDGYVLSKAGVSLPGGRGREARRAVAELMLELLEQGDLASDLSIESCQVVAEEAGSFTIRIGEGRVKLPSIVRTEAFYETGRFGLLRDLTKGRPSIGLTSVEGTLPVFALTLLATMMCEVAMEVERRQERRLLWTIDVRLGPRLPGPRLGLVLGHVRRVVRWLRRSGIGTYAEDFDAVRLAVLFRLYSSVEELLALRGLEPVQVKFHVVSATGRRFLKTLEFSIPLQQVFVLDASMRSIFEEAQQRLALANSLAHALVGLARLDRLQAGMELSIPAIAEARAALKRVSYAVLDGNLKAALDSVYYVCRLLREGDFTSSLASGVSASVRGWREAVGAPAEAEQVRGDIRSVMSTLRELCGVAA